MEEINTDFLRVGITASAFDLLHAGHLSMLKEARSKCDFLICCLHVDPSVERPSKNKPVQSLLERQIQLEGCRYVDKVIVYETESDLEEILRLYKIDIRFIGEEYRDVDFTGKKLCNKLGIEIYYNSRKHSFSSSSMRKRVFESEAAKLNGTT